MSHTVRARFFLWRSKYRCFFMRCGEGGAWVMTGSDYREWKRDSESLICSTHHLFSSVFSTYLWGVLGVFSFFREKKWTVNHIFGKKRNEVKVVVGWRNVVFFHRYMSGTIVKKKCTCSYFVDTFYIQSVSNLNIGGWKHTVEEVKNRAEQSAYFKIFTRAYAVKN